MKALFRRAHLHGSSSSPSGAANHAHPNDGDDDYRAPLSYAEAKAARDRSLGISSHDALGGAGPAKTATTRSSYFSAPDPSSSHGTTSSKRSSTTPRPAEALRELRSRWRASTAGGMHAGAGGEAQSQGRAPTPRRGQGPAETLQQHQGAAPPTSWRPPMASSGAAPPPPPSPPAFIRPQPNPSPLAPSHSASPVVASHHFGDVLSAAVAAEEAAMPRASLASPRPAGLGLNQYPAATSSSSGPISRSRSPLSFGGPSPSIPPSNSNPSNITTAPSGMPAPTPSLAAELNELAIAHADGLLADDEYRALRTALFERMGEGGLRVPREAEVTGFAGLPIGVAAVDHQRSQSLADGATGKAAATTKSPYPPPAPSSRKLSLRSSASSLRSNGRTSVQDVASLFRRKGAGMGTSASDRDEELAATTTARSISISGASGRQSSMAGGKRPSTLSLRRLANGSGGEEEASAEERRRLFAERRANSLGISYHARPGGGGGTSPGAGPSSASSAQGLVPPRPGSISGRSASSNGGPSQGHSHPTAGGGTTSVSNLSLSGPQPTSAAASKDYTLKSAADIVAEVSVVEAEGRRVLESITALGTAAVNRSRGTMDPGSVERAIEGASPRVKELAELMGIGVGGVGAKQLDTPTTGGAGRFAGLAAVATGTWGRKRSLSTLKPGVSGNGNGVAGPPSSYRQQHTSSRPDATTTTTVELDGRRASLPTSAAAHALLLELGDVARKRQDVARRYEEKLAFLRSMLRAARIREGLR